MKIACLADTHLNDHGRLDDAMRVLRSFVEAVAEEGVDLILHGGDFFDRMSTPQERLRLAHWLFDLGEIAPVVGVRGNHDAQQDLEIFNFLDTTNPVAVLDGPGSVRPPSCNATVICVPWFDKGNLASFLAAGDGSLSRTTLELEAAAVDILLWAQALAKLERVGGRVPILLAHLMVAGSTTAAGQTVSGRSVSLTPALLQEVGAAFACVGHVHMHQLWEGACPVFYPGSTDRQNFGEPEDKGWCLVTLDEEGASTVEFRKLPARPMERLTLMGYRSGRDTLPHVAPGTMLRVRVHGSTEALAAVDAEAIEREYIERGAFSCKVEKVPEVEDREQRSEAIVSARSLEDKLRAYLAAKKIDVDDERMTRLLDKLAHLERGC